jgi:hypothetical protein
MQTCDTSMKNVFKRNKLVKTIFYLLSKEKFLRSIGNRKIVDEKYTSLHFFQRGKNLLLTHNDIGKYHLILSNIMNIQFINEY